MESKLPLTENRLAVLGWVYMVAPELLPGQSCLCLLRAYRFLSAQNAFDFDREREVKKNVNLQLPPDKKGVDLHISVWLQLLLLLY